MKIEIKNVSINQKFSEETLMFMADVYVDGKKAARAKNDGHGGSTFIQSYEGQRALLEAVEKYAKSLPLRWSKAKGDKFDHEQDLEGLIDDMVYKIDAEKQKEKFNKKMQKDMIKCVIAGVPNSGSYRLQGWKIPLREVMLQPNGKMHVQNLVDKIKAQLKPGEQILNTNLTALGITI